MIPQCKIGPVKSYEQAMGSFVPKLRTFYDDPTPFAVEPFQIYGNVYYVGDQKVCMHLIDTGAGLILFDCGYGHTTELIEMSVRRLGFDPKEIKILIISHGHFDHFGSGNALRQKYGCKVYLSGVETRLLRERPDRALIHLGPCPDDEICWPDVLIEDGDVITLGNTSIRCVLAPGHTYGTMAFFFHATDGETARYVGYWGGVGFLTVYGGFCRDYGLPVGKHLRMAESIQKLRQEPVELMLGNHPPQNCTLEKRTWMWEHPGENPFVNPAGWTEFLDTVETRLAEFVALGYRD